MFCPAPPLVNRCFPVGCLLIVVHFRKHAIRWDSRRSMELILSVTAEQHYSSYREYQSKRFCIAVDGNQTRRPALTFRKGPLYWLLSLLLRRSLKLRRCSPKMWCYH